MGLMCTAMCGEGVGGEAKPHHCCEPTGFEQLELAGCKCL